MILTWPMADIFTNSNLVKPKSLCDALNDLDTSLWKVTPMKWWSFFVAMQGRKYWCHKYATRIVSQINQNHVSNTSRMRLINRRHTMWPRGLWWFLGWTASSHSPPSLLKWVCTLLLASAYTSFTRTSFWNHLQISIGYSRYNVDVAGIPY